MGSLLCLGAVAYIVAVLWTFSIMKAASDADDQMESWYLEKIQEERIKALTGK